MSANVTEAIDGLATVISTTNEYLFLAILAGIAATMLFLMITKREMMMGFPSMLFWVILMAYCYTQSTVTWDTYYLLFFSSLGMAIFSMLAMFSLRRQDLAEPDIIPYGGYIGEGEETEKTEEEPLTEQGGDKKESSSRIRDIRGRAEMRHGRGVRKKFVD